MVSLPVRIGIASTYPPQRCGIGTYTRALTHALADASGTEVLVLAEEGALAGHEGGVRSLPCFRRSGDFVREIFAAATASHCDVVHVQHAPDIFGMDERLPLLLRSLQAAGVRCFVTLHTVYDRHSGSLQGRFAPARFHRTLARHAYLVVHQERGMVDVLVAQGVPRERIHVIPHGTRAMELPPDAEAARARFGLASDAFVLLCLGFVHTLKNLHTPLLAMPQIVGADARVHLVIAGTVQRGQWYNRLYEGWLHRLARRPGARGHVTMLSRFVTDEEIGALLRAADLMLLPYAQAYGSASGVAHLALAAGLPVLCSHSPKFAELADTLGAGILVPTFSRSAWSARVLELAANVHEMARLRQATRSLAERTAWRAVAEATLQAYGAAGAEGRADDGTVPVWGHARRPT
jgi:glycosyltransferase involved in cell wall biosynthesis